ncbi:MAG TPA: acyl-CoA dehydrogenase family protein [Caulobacteraceae bacterium]|jgi:acyl-CoA dehydrogenase|nr:acyl-CoA dehydrogenase family protein [Caulobacteraceae bacterium]
MLKSHLKAVDTQIEGRVEADNDPAPERGDILARAQRVAAVAALHADVVDREGRFPHEAITAAKEEGLFALLVPAHLGGEAASLADVADVCYALGAACASTGMIYAMHQVKVACVVDHCADSAWHQDLLRRLAREQLLFASSTTEGKKGGDVRSSEAPVVCDGGGISLTRDASVISYGEYADAIITTARRNPEADGADQVLVCLMKGQYSLERTMNWETLGMRGTCSAGFTLKAEAAAEQIIPTGYETIHARSMVPAAHLLWSSAWTGVASGAVERARRFMRRAARGGATPPGAQHFTRAVTDLNTLRGLVAASLARYEAAIAAGGEALHSIDFHTAISLLKVEASELAVAVVMSAMRATGLSGYRNDTDVSIGRALRDILSSPIMINNDRILGNLASSVLVAGAPRSLRG